MELLYAAHVPPGEGPHPALVLLHGWGASGHDLLGLAPILHGGQAVVLCPQGGLAMEVAPGMAGYGWFMLGEGREPDPVEVGRSVETVSRFIDWACDRYPVDRERLVLGGFSQGGFMAYQLALRDPKRFAGLLVMSSWLPDGLLGDVDPSPEHAALPTLIVHGTEDPMLPVERGRESRELVARLGVKATYREYPMGHEISPEALRDIMAWLDGEVLGPPPAG